MSDPWWDPSCDCCAAKRESELAAVMTDLEQHFWALLKHVENASNLGQVQLLVSKGIEHNRIKHIIDVDEKR